MSAAAGVPSRPLALLVLAVLGAHLLVLRATPPALSWVAMPAPLVPPAPAPIVRVRMAQAEPAAAHVAEAAQAPAPAATATPPRTRMHQETSSAPVGSAVPAAAAPALVTGLVAPEAARWRYAVQAMRRGVLLQGESVLTWAPAGSRYEAALVTDVSGLPRREQRSAGAIVEGEGLRPQRFSDRVRSEQATHFDRAAGQVVFSSNQPAVALEQGAQDRVSVLVQLLALARAGPGRLVPGSSVTVQVAGTRGADAWTFAVGSWDSLDLPGGAVQALKLTRPPAREYDLRMEVWIAPDYGPVRLRLTPPNGDWLDLQWSGTDKG